MNPRIKKITHDDKEYEIRGGNLGDSYQAAVFHNNKRLCENLRLSTEAADDRHLYHGEKALDFLFRALESDIRSGIIRA